MRESPIDRVRLTDETSIANAKALLMARGRVELQLPPDFHHVLYAKMQPVPPNNLELVDVEGGAELLEEIAHIKGLSMVGELIETVKATGAFVQVVSPGPLIILTLPHKATHP